MLKAGLEQEGLQSLHVEDAYRRNPPTVSENMRFGQVMRKMIEGTVRDFPVTDDQGHLVGVLSFDTLREFVYESNVNDLILAKELMDDDPKTLTLADNLGHALNLFAETDQEELPVVDANKSEILLGMVSRRQVLDAYRRELRRRTASEV